MATAHRIRRRRIKARGELDPTRFYTPARCMWAAGLGANSLSAARKSGIVTALYNPSGMLIYRGSELMAWIEHITRQRREAVANGE